MHAECMHWSMSLHLITKAYMQLHKLACSYMSLHAVPWPCMQFPELSWSSMSLYEVPWGCMQFHELVCSSFLCQSSSQESVLVFLTFGHLKKMELWENHSTQYTIVSGQKDGQTDIKTFRAVYAAIKWKGCYAGLPQIYQKRIFEYYLDKWPTLV